MRFAKASSRNAIVVAAVVLLVFINCAWCAADNSLTVRIVDDKGMPIVNSSASLMREGVFQPVATAATDIAGAAHFALADAVQGRFYIYAILDGKSVPYELFYNDLIHANYTYISPVFLREPGKTVELKLDWNKWLLLRQAEVRNFNSLYLRTEDAPHYLLHIAAPAVVSYSFVFLPMNRTYKVWRVADEDNVNEYLAWWDFYALPGETVNVY